MKTTFRGQYHINDGYVGKSRPQYLIISADNLEDDMTDEQLEMFYEEEVYTHFEQNITPSLEDLTDFVAWAREQIANRVEK